MNRRFTASVVAVVGLLLAVGLVVHQRPRSEPSRPVSASGSGSTGARPGRLGVAPTPPPSGALRIQGVVLDDRGPVAGVRVSASRPEAGQTLSELPCPPDVGPFPSDEPKSLPDCVEVATSLILELTGAREGEAPVYAEAVTAGDGTFVLEGLPPGSFTLWASSEQGAGSRAGVPAGVEGVELRLGDGLTLEGLVLGEGAPLPEARITVIHAGHTRFFDARTDADGRFRIGPLPLSPYLLAISADGWMPGLFTSAGLEDSGGGLELVRPRRLTGRVLSGGAPVPGVEVLLEPRFRPMGVVRRVKTDAEGRFLFESLSPQACRLTVEEAGRSALAHLEPAEGESWPEVVLELGETFFVEGTVRDEAGHPVPGAQVGATWVDRSQLDQEEPDPWDQRTRTGPDGRYRLGPVKPGLYVFSIAVERYRVGEGSQHEVERGMGPMDFTLERASLVEGTVVDTDGQPLPHLELSLLRPGRPNPRHGNLAASGRSDAEGRFVLVAPGAGPYLLDIQDEAVLPGQQLQVQAPSEGVRVVLRRGGSVSGTFTDHQGIPVPEGVVSSWDLGEKGGAVRTGRVDQTGRFLLRGVAPGRYMVEALQLTASVERSTAVPVEVKDGEQVEVSLQLEVGRTLAGVVVDGSGQPVAGAFINASPSSAPAWQRAGEEVAVVVQEMPMDVRSGPDGRFTLSHLGAQAYDVSVRKEGYRRPGGEAVRVGAGSSAVRIVLDRLGSIRGRLVGPTGAPITRFRVNGKLQTEPGGAFAVLFEKSGTEALAISAPEMAPMLRSVPVRDGIDVDLGELRMGPGRTVRGRVLDAETSEPVMGAVIRFIDASLDSTNPLSYHWTAVHAADDGSFRLSNVEARPHTLVVEHQDYWSKRLSLDERAEELTVRLETGAWVEVRVHDTQGQLMGATLDFERDGGGHRGSYASQGTDLLGGLEPGHYTVRVRPHESSQAVFFRPRRVQVPASGRVSFTFDAEAGGATVRLTVRDKNVRSVWLRSGSAPPLVSRSDLEPALSSSADADREGESDEQWVLDHIPPGPATLLLVEKSMESRVHREELVIPAGGTLTREVRPVWQALADDED